MLGPAPADPATDPLVALLSPRTGAGGACGAASPMTPPNPQPWVSPTSGGLPQAAMGFTYLRRAAHVAAAVVHEARHGVRHGVRGGRVLGAM